MGSHGPAVSIIKVAKGIRYDSLYDSQTTQHWFSFKLVNNTGEGRKAQKYIVELAPGINTDSLDTGI
jgi:hypothetical protein